MKINDFIANIINYYFPMSDFVKAALAGFLIDKEYSEKDFDKLYKWLLKNYSRKWRVAPDIAIIVEAEEAINDYAERYGDRDDYIDYKKNKPAQIEASYAIEQDYSEDIKELFGNIYNAMGKKKEDKNDGKENTFGSKNKRDK